MFHNERYAVKDYVLVVCIKEYTVLEPNLLAARIHWLHEFTTKMDSVTEN